MREFEAQEAERKIGINKLSGGTTMTPEKIAAMLRRVVDKEGQYVEGHGTVVKANLLLGLASEIEAEAKLDAEAQAKPAS